MILLAVTPAWIREAAERYGRERSMSQIPLDLVVKFQTVDIVEVIELSWSDEAHPKIV